MIKKGILLIWTMAGLLTGYSSTTIPPSTTDLWDVSQGVVITGTSGIGDPSSPPGMFGGSGGPETLNTLFVDQTAGFTHYIEWRTTRRVNVNEIRLYDRGDNNTSYREFSKFTLKAKSLGSSTFDITVYTWTPNHPMTQLDPVNYLVLDAAVSVTAQDFRAEVVQLNAGPRIMELDAFGSVELVAPAITAHPADVAVIAGQTAVFSANATGSDLAFQWTHEGTNVVYSDRVKLLNGHDLQISAATPVDAGVYRLVVSNTVGSAASNPATLSVQTFPPAITFQPVSGTNYLGNSVPFAIGVSGTEPVSVQWLHAGTNIAPSGRVQINGHDLLISAINLDDAGAYQAFVTSPYGSTQSVTVTLTALVDETSPVILITNPIEGAVGVSMLFTGSISDNNRVSSARWEKNGADMGALVLNNGTFTVNSVALAPGENLLKVIATDPAGNVGTASVRVQSNAIAHSSKDVFDVSQGSIVTGTSGLYSAEPTLGMLGGSGGNELLDTLFADRGSGFVHTVDWRTQVAVAVTNVKVFSRGDGNTSTREFAAFTLKAKSPGSTNYDVTLFSYTPPSHPWPQLDPNSFLMLDTNFPAVIAQEFRAEVKQLNTGPRVMEVDAFGPNGAPQILAPPQSRTNFLGSSAILNATVSGQPAIAFQWKHNGTNLVEGGRFAGTRTATLTVTNLSFADAGEFTLFLTNSYGNALSDAALVTIVADTTSPTVLITAPAAGPQGNQTFTLSGVVLDNDRVASLQWLRNGTPQGSIPFSGTNFFVPGLSLLGGENRITVIAEDASANRGSAEVIVTWSPPRMLQLEVPSPQREGGRFKVPVTLVSTGGVSGATFTIGFDTNYVADPQFQWIGEDGLGQTSTNFTQPTKYLASFAIAGNPLKAGVRALANISFRARSVPADMMIPLTLGLVGFYAETGDEYTNGNFSASSSVTITRRRIIGDSNGNDHLESNDASIILQFISQLELARPWDITGNDLNKNGKLDLGDAIKVLRVAAGLDQQPSAGAQLLALAPLEPLPASSIKLTPSRTTLAPGDSVVVDVRLADQTAPINGTSFRVDYSTNALRLDSYTVGDIIPGDASTSTATNIQPGFVGLATANSKAWPTNNGILARMSFTALAPGASVNLHDAEVSHGGYEDELLNAASITFDSPPSQFSSSVTFGAGGVAHLTLTGLPGVSYKVEASSDLIHWDTVGVYSSATGTIQIDDSAGAGETERFYKATQQ